MFFKHFFGPDDDYDRRKHKSYKRETAGGNFARPKQFEPEMKKDVVKWRFEGKFWKKFSDRTLGKKNRVCFIPPQTLGEIQKRRMLDYPI